MLYYMSGFLWYAVAGYYCKKYININKISLKYVIIGFLILISPLYVFIIKQYSNCSVGTSSCLFPMFTTMMAFIVIMNIKYPHWLIEGFWHKAVELLSRLSFGIYLVHMLIMYPFRIWIAQYNINYIIQIPVTVVFVGICSVILSWLLSKLSFGKYLIG